jgi:integrase
LSVTIRNGSFPWLRNSLRKNRARQRANHDEAERENIDDIAVLIDSVPQILLLAVEVDNTRDSTPGDLVFVRRYNKPWKSWSTAWDNACERAGLKDFRFHDLRHCFGSWLAMNGTAPKAMMELMGHKTPAMTMRYSHLFRGIQTADRSQIAPVR